MSACSVCRGSVRFACVRLFVWFPYLVTAVLPVLAVWSLAEEPSPRRRRRSSVGVSTASSASASASSSTGVHASPETDNRCVMLLGEGARK